MGQCVSSKSDRKDPDSEEKYLQPSCLSLQEFPTYPPLKEKTQSIQITAFDQNSKASSFSYGSEKEAFYDTQPWLDSDCEDDFYSVNGDLIPSRGGTPVHVSFASPEVRRSPCFHSRAITSSTPEPCPGRSQRKKSLSDLFEESGRYVTEAGIMGSKAVINRNEEECVYTSATGSPFVEAARVSYSGKKTPQEKGILKKVSSLNSVKCCLPQLLLCQSSSSCRKHEIFTK